MSKLTYKIYTLGCKVNQYDSGCLEKVLGQQGIKLAKMRASLAIINTCAVTKTAISKDQKMINLAKKENPQARIIVLGCWPKAYQPSMTGVDLWWPERDWKKLVAEIIARWGDKKNNKPLETCAFQLIPSDKSRYFIKIQDGCRQFCSYCIIPFTRGELESRPPKEILEEIRAAIKSGYQEIVLSGIHLGLYGADLKERINLSEIIRRIIKLSGLGRVRLSSIEITEVSNELIELMKSNRKFCQHLHISLQSGSDKILKLMNRPYTKKYFADRVKRLRQACPNVSLTTDIIVGFPGESEADFLETYNFAKKIGFSKIHVFSFSAHEKTKAFSLPHKVRPEVIKLRSEKLRQLSKELEERYRAEILKKYKNKLLPVVVEATRGEKWRGKTEFYFDVYFSKAQMKTKLRNLIGKIIDIKL